MSEPRPSAQVALSPGGDLEATAQRLVIDLDHYISSALGFVLSSLSVSASTTTRSIFDNGSPTNLGFCFPSVVLGIPGSLALCDSCADRARLSMLPVWSLERTALKQGSV